MSNPIDLGYKFKALDPLSSQPFSGQDRLNDIAARARRHLHRARTREQIEEGVEDIKTVISDCVDSLEQEREADSSKRIRELSEMIMSVEIEQARGADALPPEEYFEYRRMFDIRDRMLVFTGDIEDIGFPAVDDLYTDLELFAAGSDPSELGWLEMPGATKAEYYAVFALWKLDEVKQLLGKTFTPKPWRVQPHERSEEDVQLGSPHHLWRLSEAKDLAIIAMDAVCTAERVKMEGALRIEQAKQSKTRARAAASQNKKHKEVRQLRAELGDWYLPQHEALQNLSNEKVAEMGIKIVPLPYRTVRDAIAALRRTLRSAS